MAPVSAAASSHGTCTASTSGRVILARAVAGAAQHRPTVRPGFQDHVAERLRCPRREHHQIGQRVERRRIGLPTGEVHPPGHAQLTGPAPAATARSGPSPSSSNPTGRPAMARGSLANACSSTSQPLTGTQRPTASSSQASAGNGRPARRPASLRRRKRRRCVHEIADQMHAPRRQAGRQQVVRQAATVHHHGIGMGKHAPACNSHPAAPHAPCRAAPASGAWRGSSRSAPGPAAAAAARAALAAGTADPTPCAAAGPSAPYPAADRPAARHPRAAAREPRSRAPSARCKAA